MNDALGRILYANDTPTHNAYAQDLWQEFLGEQRVLYSILQLIAAGLIRQDKYHLVLHSCKLDLYARSTT